MSDTTTEAGFYRLTGPDGEDPLVFCAPCALVNTNPVLMLHGIAPADSMADAALLLHTQMALNGDDPDPVLTYHEHGTCELCGREN